MVFRRVGREDLWPLLLIALLPLLIALPLLLGFLTATYRKERPGICQTRAVVR
jgi:hypothetical protein